MEDEFPAILRQNTRKSDRIYCVFFLAYQKITLLTKLVDLKGAFFCVGFGEEEFVRLSPTDDDEPKVAEKPPFKADSGLNGLVMLTAWACSLTNGDKGTIIKLPYKSCKVPALV